MERMFKVLMLTLQNDPPTIETCGDGVKEYKKFSKTFKKMIASCLSKDPQLRYAIIYIVI